MIAGPALVTQSNMAALLGPILFVVVIVGGLGSLAGAFVASLLIGLVQTFAVAFNGSLAEPVGTSPRRRAFGDLWSVTVAAARARHPLYPDVLVLIFRPRGLLGTRDT